MNNNNDVLPLKLNQLNGIQPSAILLITLGNSSRTISTWTFLLHFLMISMAVHDSQKQSKANLILYALYPTHSSNHHICFLMWGLSLRRVKFDTSSSQIIFILTWRSHGYKNKVHLSYVKFRTSLKLHTWVHTQSRLYCPSVPVKGTSCDRCVSKPFSSLMQWQELHSRGQTWAGQ